jgi:hypothetical protein
MTELSGYPPSPSLPHAGGGRLPTLCHALAPAAWDLPSPAWGGDEGGGRVRLTGGSV